MPHQCTTCDRTFADGSKEMLGGCPDCGGNKFQFLPKGAVDSTTDEVERVASTATSSTSPVEDTTPPARPDPPRPEADADIIEAPAEPIESSDDIEDRAQASARRAIVADDELPTIESSREAEEPDEPTDSADRPDLATLRHELNEQFESIKILQPGEYELNLMELYDRQEYIIALEEDGRYVINVPDTWSDED